MKKLIPIFASTMLFLSACGGVGKLPVDPTTSEKPGTMLSYESSSSYDAEYLNSAVHKGLCPNGTDCTQNFANAATDFKFHAESIVNSTQNYSMLYSTVGVMAENRAVSGGVIIPNLPESQIKGVVLYYHETEVSKKNAPSCFHNPPTLKAYCSSDDIQTYGEELGGIIAASGYIVVMPDYIGLGFDRNIMHPYVLYPEVNALSGLYMLQATNMMLAKLGYQTEVMNLYITGFSEGGAYALWASNMLQNISPNFLSNTQFKLKATVGMSGAYDLVKAQMPMEEASITEGDSYNVSNNDTATYAKPTISSYTMTAYGFYDLDQTYTDVFNTEVGNGFYYCLGCADVFGSLYKVPELYLKPDLEDSKIKSALYQSALLVSYGPQNANNSVRPLVNTAILMDQKFNQALEYASITVWKTTSPVTLISLAQDSVVTNLNTQNAYNGLINKSELNLVQRVIIENSRGSSRYMVNNVDPITDQTALMPLDHIGSGYYQLIAAMNVINQYQAQ